MSVYKQAVLLHLANLGVRDLRGIAGFRCHANKKYMRNHSMRKADKLKSYKIL